MGKSTPCRCIALLVSWLLLASCAISGTATTPLEWAREKKAYYVESDFARLGVTNPQPGAIATIWFLSAPITDSDIAELAALKPEVYSIGLGRSKLTDAGAHHLGTITTLRTIDMNGTSITDEGMGAFANMPDLYWLVIDETLISDVGIAKLKHLAHLRVLNLRRTQINGFGLSGFMALQRLKLSDTPLQDDALEGIARLPKLGHLDMRNTPLTDEGIAHLAAASATPGFLRLDIGRTQVTDRGVVALASLAERLESLDLDETAITDASVDELIKMRHLNRLNVYNTYVTEAGYNRLRKAFPEITVGWHATKVKSLSKP